MNRHAHTPTPDAVIKARVAAAIANCPTIKPSELARLTGLSLGAAIAMLEKQA